MAALGGAYLRMAYVFGGFSCASQILLCFATKLTILSADVYDFVAAEASVITFGHACAWV